MNKCVVFIVGIIFLLNSNLLCAQKNIKIESKEVFQKIISLQLSKITTGNSFTNFGQYASIKNDDKTLTFSGIILSKKKPNNLWSFELSGGVSGGITSIFDDFTLNSNVGGKITYNRIINFKKNRVAINTTELEGTEKALKDTKLKFISDSIKIVSKKELIDVLYKLAKLTSTKAKLEKMKKNYSVNSKLRNDSIQLAYALAINEKGVLDAKKKELNDEYFEYKLEIRTQKFDKDVKDQKKKIGSFSAEDIDLTWFSFGYGFKRDKFKLFDSSRPLSKQLRDEFFVSQEVNIGVSRYRHGRVNKNDKFWSLGVSFSYGSNLSSLTTVEVLETNQLSQNPDVKSVKKTEAYIDEFKDKLKGLIVFYDYYNFIGNQVDFAIHLKPDVVIRDNEKPKSSFLAGILIPFKKKDDVSSIVNVEFFYRLNDIFNVSDSDEGLLSRNTIGLKATFPINFLTSK